MKIRIRELSRRIQRQFFGRLALGRLAGSALGRRDAPYRRVGKVLGELHRPILLNLETSDGSGQACHPDVLYIRGGFGSKKWPYWMVCTPYPYKDNRVENPEIFVSYDGIIWAGPDGGQNPIVATPKVAGDHNSDPDMVFYENQMWLFYRETQKSRAPGKTPDRNIIYLLKSKDGVQWTPPVTGRFVSPLVVPLSHTKETLPMPASKTSQRSHSHVVDR